MENKSVENRAQIDPYPPFVVESVAMITMYMREQHRGVCTIQKKGEMGKEQHNPRDERKLNSGGRQIVQLYLKRIR